MGGGGKSFMLAGFFEIFAGFFTAACICGYATGYAAALPSGAPFRNTPGDSPSVNGLIPRQAVRLCRLLSGDFRKRNTYNIFCSQTVRERKLVSRFVSQGIGETKPAMYSVSPGVWGREPVPHLFRCYSP
jgi:hypothetical protein